MTEGSCKLVGQLRISGLVKGEVVTQMVPMKHMLLLVTSASRLFMMETRSTDQMLVQPYFELIRSDVDSKRDIIVHEKTNHEQAQSGVTAHIAIPLMNGEVHSVNFIPSYAKSRLHHSASA